MTTGSEMYHDVLRIAETHAQARLVLGPDAQRALDEANTETRETGGLVDDYLRAVRRKMSAGPRRVLTPEQLHDIGIGNATSRAAKDGGDDQ